MDPPKDQPQTSEVIESGVSKHTAPEAAVDVSGEPPSKKTKLDDSPAANGQPDHAEPRQKRGVAPVKAEYVWRAKPSDWDTNWDIGT